MPFFIEAFSLDKEHSSFVSSKPYESLKEVEIARFEKQQDMLPHNPNQQPTYLLFVRKAKTLPHAKRQLTRILTEIKHKHS